MTTAIKDTTAAVNVNAEAFSDIINTPIGEIDFDNLPPALARVLTRQRDNEGGEVSAFQSFTS